MRKSTIVTRNTTTKARQITTKCRVKGRIFTGGTHDKSGERIRINKNKSLCPILTLK